MKLWRLRSHRGFSAKNKFDVDGLFKFIDQLYLLLSRMNYIVFILKSSKDGGYYYGYTSDLEERLMRHNEGLVRSKKAQPSL